MAYPQEKHKRKYVPSCNMCVQLSMFYSLFLIARYNIRFLQHQLYHFFISTADSIYEYYDIDFSFLQDVPTFFYINHLYILCTNFNTLSTNSYCDQSTSLHTHLFMRVCLEKEITKKATGRCGVVIHNFDGLFCYSQCNIMLTQQQKPSIGKRRIFMYFHEDGDMLAGHVSIYKKQMTCRQYVYQKRGQ